MKECKGSISCSNHPPQFKTHQTKESKRFQMRESNQSIRIRILNVVLNHIYSHDWTNYDNFADSFVDGILDQFETGVLDPEKVLEGLDSTFFRLNSITRDKFLSEQLSTRIKDAWTKSVVSSIPI